MGSTDKKLLKNEFVENHSTPPGSDDKELGPESLTEKELRKLLRKIYKICSFSLLVKYLDEERIRYLKRDLEFWFTPVPYDKVGRKKFSDRKLESKKKEIFRKYLEYFRPTTGAICTRALEAIQRGKHAQVPMKVREKEGKYIVVDEGEFFTYTFEFLYKLILDLSGKEERFATYKYFQALTDKNKWMRKRLHNCVFPWMRAVIQNESGEFSDWHKAKRDWFLKMPFNEELSKITSRSAKLDEIFVRGVASSHETPSMMFRRIRFNPILEYWMCSKNLLVIPLATDGEVGGYRYIATAIVSLEYKPDVTRVPQRLYNLLSVYYSRDLNRLSTEGRTGVIEEPEPPDLSQLEIEQMPYPLNGDIVGRALEHLHSVEDAGPIVSDEGIKTLRTPALALKEAPDVELMPERLAYTSQELEENQKYLAKLYALNLLQYPIAEMAKVLDKDIRKVQTDLERLSLTKKTKRYESDLFWELGVLDKFQIHVTESGEKLLEDYLFSK